MKKRNATTTASRPVGMLVPHTHWDREWRYPLWKNRMLLVGFMDQLLEILETQPSYRNIVLDGQVVPVLDYLEVKPENRARLLKQIRKGRISVGPWYTLPDLYPLDGECLVRNLLRGTQEAEALGGCLRVGYNSFGWGQTAQFPQIYAGFGIEFIIAAKKVSKERAPACEYLWEAPDGTRTFSSRLGQHARANFYVNAYIDLRVGCEYHGPEFRFAWEKAPLAVHECAPGEAHKDWFVVGGTTSYFPALIPQVVERAWKAMDETRLPEFRLLMSGCDFTSPQPILGQIIKDANQAFPERRFVHGSLDEYIAELRRQVDPKTLPLVKGELRDGAAPDNSGNALATRIHLKLANKQAENVLLRRAEPLAAGVGTLGASYPGGFLRCAWTQLLQAHPHDSINGVTQDKTADDTLNRIAQAQEIGEVVAEQAAEELIARLDLARYAADDLLLVLINPRPVPAREMLRLCLDTPQERGIWDFGAEDPQGRELAVQHIARQALTKPVHDLEARPWPFALDRHEVWIDSGEIPAGGWTVLRLKPRNTFNHKAEFWAPTRTSRGDEISQRPNLLENEHLRAEVAANGTVTLTDKAGGQVFSGLFAYEDTGETGDYWVDYRPYRNRTITSETGSARCWLEENGPLAATLAIEVVMQVPARAERAMYYSQGESRRVDELVALPITTRLTLRKGSRSLDVRTTVQNSARDHRLRVALPSGIAAAKACADGHFTVDERPLHPPVERDGGWFEERLTNPMGKWVDLSDGQRGLAVVSDSFTEFEQGDDDRRTLFLTLVRSVRNIICTEFRSGGHFPHQEGGQCLRTLDFRYRLLPHQGGWAEGGVVAESAAHNAPIQPWQATPRSRGELPASGSLFALEGANLVLDAFKRSEDGEAWIVRVHNPGDAAVEGRITLQARVKAACLARLDEQRGKALKVQGGHSVAFSAGAKKIVTLRLTTA